jgi:hypothetical protein
MEFTKEDSVLLKKQVIVGDKIWWVHPDKVNDDGKIDAQQVERIMAHGEGPFVLLEIKKYKDGTKLCFMDCNNVQVEENCDYFSA